MVQAHSFVPVETMKASWLMPSCFAVKTEFSLDPCSRITTVVFHPELGWAEALADAIVQLSEMPNDMRQMMGARARDFAREHFDYEVTARRLAARF